MMSRTYQVKVKNRKRNMGRIFSGGGICGEVLLGEEGQGQL